MRSLGFTTALAVHAGCLAIAGPLAPRKLQFDDVILVGADNSMSIMKEAEYERRHAHHQSIQMLKNTKGEAEYSQYKEAPPRPQYLPSNEPRRKCLESTETQVLLDTLMTDWDVPLSPVIGNRGHSRTSVSVTQGYSLYTEIVIETDTEGLLKPVADQFLMHVKGIDSDLNWRTSQDLSITFEVPPGQYGVIISQPFVRRIEGKILTGCTDAPQVHPFWTNSFTSKSYGDLAWVDGIIRMCNSSSYPVPYCNGWGEHA